MSEIEIEIKGDWTLRKDPMFTIDCRVCGMPAVRTMEFGEVKNRHGSGHTFDLCLAPGCLESAMDECIEELTHLKSHRLEYSQKERWDHRDGK